MPARRAAADEPQPLPIGMSFLMRRASGMTGCAERFEDFAVGGEDEMVLQCAGRFPESRPVARMEKSGAGRASMVM